MRVSRAFRRSRRFETGQSVVEFALVLPLMLILLLAILLVSRRDRQSARKHAAPTA